MCVKVVFLSGKHHYLSEREKCNIHKSIAFKGLEKAQMCIDISQGTVEWTWKSRTLPKPSLLNFQFCSDFIIILFLSHASISNPALVKRNYVAYDILITTIDLPVQSDVAKYSRLSSSICRFLYGTSNSLALFSYFGCPGTLAM